MEETVSYHISAPAAIPPTTGRAAQLRAGRTAEKLPTIVIIREKISDNYS